jgi:hypothetical protein
MDDADERSCRRSAAAVRRDARAHRRAVDSSQTTPSSMTTWLPVSSTSIPSPTCRDLDDPISIVNAVFVMGRV